MFTGNAGFAYFFFLLSDFKLAKHILLLASMFTEGNISYEFTTQYHYHIIILYFNIIIVYYTNNTTNNNNNNILTVKCGHICRQLNP